jgi:hypothetical protein
LIAGIAPTGGEFQNPRSPNLLHPDKDPTNFPVLKIGRVLIRVQQIR